MSVYKSIRIYGEMIKFSHTVFALPFALSSVALASREHLPAFEQIFWILMAMVGARSAAMGFNRLVDHSFDALNPRTQSRALPRGFVSKKEVGLFIVFFSLLFIFSAYRLNRLCFLLSPVVLFLVFFYSYTKRFTWTSHFFLGAAIGIAPSAAWLALTGSLDRIPLLLTLAVLTWIAGFDILYACQDYEFDITHGLYSIPQRFGISNALFLARVLHGVTFLCFFAVGLLSHRQLIYGIGLSVIAGLLIYEHWLIKPEDLSKIDLAFFKVNGMISILFFLITLADVVIYG